LTSLSHWQSVHQNCWYYPKSFHCYLWEVTVYLKRSRPTSRPTRPVTSPLPPCTRVIPLERKSHSMSGVSPCPPPPMSRRRFPLLQEAPGPFFCNFPLSFFLNPFRLSIPPPPFLTSPPSAYAIHRKSPVPLAVSPQPEFFRGQSSLPALPPPSFVITQFFSGHTRS